MFTHICAAIQWGYRHKFALSISLRVNFVCAISESRAFVVVGTLFFVFLPLRKSFLKLNRL